MVAEHLTILTVLERFPSIEIPLLDFLLVRDSYYLELIRPTSPRSPATGDALAVAPRVHHFVQRPGAP